MLMQAAPKDDLRFGDSVVDRVREPAQEEPPKRSVHRRTGLTELQEETERNAQLAAELLAEPSTLTVVVES